MSTYAIGDVQGCFDELQALLLTFHFDPQEDTLWFLGDVVNRGPKNLETVQFLMTLPNIKLVLGNHDLHFLAVASGVKKQSKNDTLDDLLRSKHLKSFVEWFRHKPLVFYDQNFDTVIVHAGLPPMWTTDIALTKAREVEQTLSSVNYVAFLKAMYGNTPAHWRDDLVGMERLRLITNYFTRIRYCKPDGEIELIHKERKTPAGFDAWFKYRNKNMQILFGHWAAIEGVTDRDDIIALDTGCVWGRSLTAYRLDDRKLFSVPAR